MVKVTPFKGITYNKEKIEKLEYVMSPPYDIISPELQKGLYKKSPYNFIRLILGEQHPKELERVLTGVGVGPKFMQTLRDQIFS